MKNARKPGIMKSGLEAKQLFLQVDMLIGIGGPLKFVWYDLTTFVLKNLRQFFAKYAVVRTEHYAHVKSTTKIFSNFLAFSENPNFN